MWQYLVKKKLDVEELNRLGEEGWELVAVVANATASRHYFKRPTGSPRRDPDGRPI